MVTGASSGLGLAYARSLATEGINVVLAARSRDTLTGIAEQLSREHGVETEALPVDLTDRAARAGFVTALADRDISHLVNNAGFGSIGDFVGIEPQRVGGELELNVVALTELSRAIAPGMISRGRGAIINVASTGAFQAIPSMAVYAATKAYVLRFSLALWEELHDTGVRVLAVCPGPTDTAFFNNAGDDSVMRRRRTPEQVVQTTFDALARHRPFVVDGLGNKALTFANRLVPATMAARIARFIASR